MTDSVSPHFHMMHALRLAKRGLGMVWPNPAVGCIIVKDNQIVGRGSTASGGRPHAEAIALAQAGEAACGATLYVTLEPCCQPGRGPACTDEIIKAGIAKVVIAIGDPDPRVAGQGIQKLQDAGIDIEIGLVANEALTVNKGFFLHITEQRPMATLKLAVSQNMKMTTGDPANPWITSAEARRHAHWLRATHDAILVGINTVLTDNPRLDCRLPGLQARSPVRIVLDSQLRIPLDSQLVQTARDYPLWIVTEKNENSEAAQQLCAQKVQLIHVNDCKNIRTILQQISERGITRLLVEGGAQTAQAFLDASCADEIALYQASHDIGERGLPAPRLPHLNLTKHIKLDKDTLKMYIGS